MSLLPQPGDSRPGDGNSLQPGTNAFNVGNVWRYVRNALRICDSPVSFIETSAVDVVIVQQRAREKGLTHVGIYYSSEGLTELLLRDFRYYRHSGGGVTLSGGECTLFPNYLEILLRRLKERNVSVVLQTCGHFTYDTFVPPGCCRTSTWSILTIKFLDGEAHKKFTGRSNRLIVENFLRLVKHAPDRVYPRVPLVPGVTATEKNLTAIFRFLHDCGVGVAKTPSVQSSGHRQVPVPWEECSRTPLQILDQG